MRASLGIAMAFLLGVAAGLLGGSVCFERNSDLLSQEALDWGLLRVSALGRAERSKMAQQLRNERDPVSSTLRYLLLSKDAKDNLVELATLCGELGFGNCSNSSIMERAAAGYQ